MWLNDHLFGKELFIRFTTSAFRKLLSVYVFSYFPFGFEGRMWNLIVSLLIFLLRTAVLYSKCQPAKYLTVKQFKPSVKR